MSFRRLCGVALGGVLAAATAAAAPAPPQLTATIPTGPAPCGAVVAYGAVWVAVDGAGTLVRIDPRRGRSTRTIRVGVAACSVAAGLDALWVTRYRPSELVRVDRRTATIRRVKVGREPFDVLLTNSVWITSFRDGTLSRINPRSLQVTRRLAIGGNPAGLALCWGRLWVGGGRRDTWLTAVDPTTNRVERVDVGTEAPSWPACVGDALWSPTAHGVVRIDARSGTVVASIALAGTPARVAAAPDGTIWVTDKEQSRVVRIDPATNSLIDEIAAGPGAFAVVRAAGSMWVTSYAGSDIRRYTPG